MNKKKQFDIIEESLNKSDEKRFLKYNIVKNLKVYRKVNNVKMKYMFHNIRFLTSIYYHYYMWEMNE